MGYALPNQATVHIALNYGSEIIITDISNASPAIISAGTDHGLVVGDVIQLDVGWSNLNNLVIRVSEISEDKITLEGIDTSDIERFAVGGGTGTMRKVEEWIEVPQITEVSNSGGEQQNTQIQFLADDRQRNLNTFKSAQSQTYTLAHDSSLPIYPVFRAADSSGEFLAAKMFVPKAKETRYWCTSISFNDTPNTAVNEVETVDAVFDMQSPGMTFHKTTGSTVAAAGALMKAAKSTTVKA